MVLGSCDVWIGGVDQSYGRVGTGRKGSAMGCGTAGGVRLVPLWMTLVGLAVEELHKLAGFEEVA